MMNKRVYSKADWESVGLGAEDMKDYGGIAMKLLGNEEEGFRVCVSIPGTVTCFPAENAMELGRKLRELSDSLYSGLYRLQERVENRSVPPAEDLEFLESDGFCKVGSHFWTKEAEGVCLQLSYNEGSEWSAYMRGVGTEYGATAKDACLAVCMKAMSMRKGHAGR